MLSESFACRLKPGPTYRGLMGMGYLLKVYEKPPFLMIKRLTRSSLQTEEITWFLKLKRHND